MTNYREQFDLPRDVCYLNASYMGPQPRVVVEAATAGVLRRSQPWKIIPIDFFTDVEALRTLYAAQVGCAADNIAIVPSAGYGIACATANIPLQSGDVVLAMHEQFPSNYYSWQRTALASGAEFHVVEKTDGESWADAYFAAIERLGKKIRVATLEGHHWASAETIDLERIIPALRDVGARVVLDLTQTVGAMPVDIKVLAPDFMVTSGYKWQFCPYGIAFMYVDDAYFDGVPIEEAWMAREGAEDFSRLAEFTDNYQSGARRYDVSEKSSFSNVAGAKAALQQLADWNIENISATLGETNERIATILQGHGFEVADPTTRAPHFQGARVPDTDPRKLAATLIENNVFASVRGDFLRVAPHLYTDEQDLARLDEVIGKALN